MTNKIKLYSNMLLCLVLICYLQNIHANMPSKLRNFARNHVNLSYEERIKKFSEYFIGIPYGSIDYKNTKDFYKLLHNGEFTYDFKNFDCVTYVETVLALASIKDKKDLVGQFEQTLKKIRYKNGISLYFKRNHFTNIDWVKNNKDIFADITKEVSKNYVLSKTKIDRLNWVYTNPTVKSAVKNKIELEDILHKNHFFLRTELSTVPYITLVDFIKNYDNYKQKFPEVAILNVVSPNWDLSKQIGTKLDISHQGFIIKKHGELYLFHATSAAPKTVTQIKLTEYLEKQLASPTIKGINILKVMYN